MLLSIVIPTRNRLQMLKKCLQSIPNQYEEDENDIEIIVVDDGSTDGTYDWLLEQSRRRNCIKVLHTDGTGVSNARNAGIDAAAGTYIRFVDSDDTVDSGQLLEMVARFQSVESEIVIGGYSRVIGTKSSFHHVRFDKPILSVEEYLKETLHCPNSYYVGVVWNKLFRSDIIKEQQIRFRSGLYFGEDFIFVNQYLQYCTTVQIIDKSVYNYYCNPDSLTTAQLKSCFSHPFENIRNKQLMFDSYRQLFVSKGLYEKYKKGVSSYYLLIGNETEL